jgi:uncharacterized phage protein (TIGR01671 family)
MSREIKFRAWHKKEKRMSPVNEYSQAQGWVHTPGEHGCYESWNKGKYEIMQYTGLKDKNGKEIYEGDVVTHPNHPHVYTVSFKDGAFGVGGMSFSELESEHSGTISSEWEVIGNIYENIELLEHDR